MAETVARHAVSIPSLPSDPASLDSVERMHIENVLKHFGFNRAKTAQALGITAKTLYLKIKRYKINVPKDS
jgi:DNA-binding NtrC family response regulator